VLHLRLALDAGRMDTFCADITGSHARIDEQEARLLGLSSGTRIISAEEVRKRTPLEDLQARDVKPARMTEHREAYHHEFRLSMPDSSERWLNAYTDVRPDRIVGVNFDATQCKFAETALRDSEARLRVANLLMQVRSLLRFTVDALLYTVAPVAVRVVLNTSSARALTTIPDQSDRRASYG
jgi:hypothetical protein